MERKKHRRRRIWIPVLAVLLLTAALPQARSLAVMSVYSALNERTSVMREKGLTVRLPGGFSTLRKDWYPFVMCFDAEDYFGRSVGRPDTRLTILYNFGAFGLRPHSSLYETDSPYYSSFYGAYLVSSEEELYGFLPDGSIDYAAMSQVPRYDFFTLVLGDFGLSYADRVFDWEILSEEPGISLGGLSDWTRLSATLRVNGCAHEKQGFVTSYLQYGAPSGACSEPFEPVELSAVLYVRAFPEKGVTVFLYGLCADEEALKTLDSRFLLRTKIIQKD